MQLYTTGFGVVYIHVLGTVAIQMYNTILVLILWQHTSSRIEGAHAYHGNNCTNSHMQGMCITLFLLMWLYEIKAVNSLLSCWYLGCAAFYTGSGKLPQHSFEIFRHAYKHLRNNYASICIIHYIQASLGIILRVLVLTRGVRRAQDLMQGFPLRLI